MAYKSVEQAIELLAILEPHGHKGGASLGTSQGILLKQSTQRCMSARRKDEEGTEVSARTRVLGRRNAFSEILLERVFVLLKPLGGIVVHVASIVFDAKHDLNGQQRRVGVGG